MSAPFALTQHLIAVLGILVALGGAAFCGAYTRRSRWAVLLMGAFLADAAVGILLTIGLPYLVRGAGNDVSRIGQLYLVASALGLAVRVAVVIGVAGLLSDLRAAAADGRPR